MRVLYAHVALICTRVIARVLHHKVYLNHPVYLEKDMKICGLSNPYVNIGVGKKLHAIDLTYIFIISKWLQLVWKLLSIITPFQIYVSVDC